MKKEKLIKAILNTSLIHHNISTLGMKLPEVPEGSPEEGELFWNTCQMLVSDFIENKQRGLQRA